MIETLRRILEGTVERLTHQATSYIPSLLAALVIFAGALVIAILVRTLLIRIFKGVGVDRFLRESGVGSIISASGRPRASRLVANTAYWAILVGGFLLALSAFDSAVIAHIIDSALALVPKLVVGGLILLAGAWLAQYLGRGTLVWAVNEELPSPRRLAAAVRFVILFVAVAVAADQLNFARNIFLAAFIILVGGAVLALSLALGLGGREAVVRYFLQRLQPVGRAGDEVAERSIWNHL